MTKEEFYQFESSCKASGRSIKSYCQEQSVSYSTYNYWRKKYHSRVASGVLSPVSFGSRLVSGSPASPCNVLIQLPTGVQIEFAKSDDAVALQVLTGICSSYVLPK